MTAPTDGGASMNQGPANGQAGTSGASSQNAPPDGSQCSGKAGPSFDEFFDDRFLSTLRISIDPVDLGGKSADQWLDVLWSQWNHCSPHNFVRASFSYEHPEGFGNTTCQDVGLRIRGSWERGTVEVQGLKLDLQVLDTSPTGVRRRFADLNRINVLSVELDPSHMMQCLAYKALRRFGLPVPYCNHLKVYVNDQYYGLLENVEQVNRGYVRRHFGTSQGSLYAASPSQDDCPPPNDFADSLAKLEYSGDSFSSYAAQYLLEGDTTAADAQADLIPMLKCGDSLQTPDDAAFRMCISDWIDVENWLRLIAAESLMPELESFVGYYRNYYLYFNPDPALPQGGRFAIWPWDLDTAFHRIKCIPTSCDPFKSVDSLYGPRNARAKLVTRLTTVFKAEYCALLNEFLTRIYQPSLVDEMVAVVEPGIAGEPNVTAAAWQAEVSKLRSFVTTQANAAKSVVDANCQ